MDAADAAADAAKADAEANPGDSERQAAYEKAKAHADRLRTDAQSWTVAAMAARDLEERAKRAEFKAQETFTATSAPKYSAGQRAEVVKGIRDLRDKVSGVASVLQDVSHLIGIHAAMQDFDPTDLAKIGEQVSILEKWVVSSGALGPEGDKIVSEVKQFVQESQFAKNVSNVFDVVNNGVDWSNPESTARLANMLGGDAWLKTGLADLTKSVQVANQLDNSINQVLQAAEDLVSAGSAAFDAACGFMDGVQKIGQGLSMIQMGMPAAPSFNMTAWAALDAGRRLRRKGRGPRRFLLSDPRWLWRCRGRAAHVRRPDRLSELAQGERSSTCPPTGPLRVWGGGPSAGPTGDQRRAGRLRLHPPRG